jgi:hypothetical protein
MKKLIFVVVFIIFLVLAFFLYNFAKEKYCYYYKSLDLNKMDSLRIQTGQRWVKDNAWNIYKAEPDSLYDNGYGAVFISKYDIKNMDMLIDLTKKVDPNKSFSENFGVIAGFGFDRRYIFFGSQKIQLPMKELREEREAYEHIKKDIFNVLDKYITENSTIIFLRENPYEVAEFVPLSSMVVQDSKYISLSEKKLFKKYTFANKIYENKFKYIMRYQEYDISDPVLCCDKNFIEKKLESNLRESKNSSNLNQNGERMDYFDYSVNLDSLDSIKVGDGLDFLDNFYNSSHRFLKREEISLAGKYRSIVEMRHSVYLGITTLEGSPVNVCNYQ